MNTRCAALVGVCVMLLFTACRSDVNHPVSGSEARLHAPNGKPLPVAVDEETLSKALGAARVHDTFATEELTRNGKIFTVADNTHSLVLNERSGAVNIRITEGEHTGKSGWVLVEWVH